MSADGLTLKGKILLLARAKGGIDRDAIAAEVIAEIESVEGETGTCCDTGKEYPLVVGMVGERPSAEGERCDDCKDQRTSDCPARTEAHEETTRTREGCFRHKVGPRSAADADTGSDGDEPYKDNEIEDCGGCGKPCAIEAMHFSEDADWLCEECYQECLEPSTSPTSDAGDTCGECAEWNGLKRQSPGFTRARICPLVPYPDNIPHVVCPTDDACEHFRRAGSEGGTRRCARGNAVPGEPCYVENCEDNLPFCGWERPRTSEPEEPAPPSAEDELERRIAGGENDQD